MTTPPAADQVDRVIALERTLLRREQRRDPGVLERLLAPDFREVGASGRAWSRDEIVAMMLEEDPGDPVHPQVIADHDMRGTLLADGLVLLEFVTHSAGRWARRTSLWRRVAGEEWQIFRHQGTPTTPPGEAVW